MLSELTIQIMNTSFRPVGGDTFKKTLDPIFSSYE